jgi:hypothetical protein
LPLAPKVGLIVFYKKSLNSCNISILLSLDTSP